MFCEEELPRPFCCWFCVKLLLEILKCEEELPRPISYWFFIKFPLEIEKSEEELPTQFSYWCFIKFSLEMEKGEEERKKAWERKKGRETNIGALLIQGGAGYPRGTSSTLWYARYSGIPQGTPGYPGVPWGTLGSRGGPIGSRGSPAVLGGLPKSKFKRKR